MLTHQGEKQGTYELSVSVNGKPSWKSQSTAIWSFQDIWMIGELNDIGKPRGGIYTAGSLFGANENSKWIYNNGEMWKELDTNEFSIECIARKGTNQQHLIQS